MPSPSVLRAVAALAPGKRVAVVAGGELYVLPAVPAPAPVAPPDPLEVAAAKLLESDAQTRDLLEAVGMKFAEVFARVDESIATVAVGQAEVVQAVTENTRTLHLPVRPRYDADGKVVEAQRVKK